MNKITKLWNSKSDIEWNQALDNYWNCVKTENKDVEESLNNLRISEIQKLDKFEWYSFLHDKYFRWKYTAPNRFTTTTKLLCQYKELNQLNELFEIKNRLLSKNILDLKIGLSIAMEIKGLGIAGASGLLSLMYPNNYGTVDQFLVKALKNVEDLPKTDLFKLQEIKLIKSKNPNDEKYNIKLDNGVFLIDLMSRKAKSNNELFRTNFWTPRKIDMILWSVRE